MMGVLLVIEDPKMNKYGSLIWKILQHSGEGKMTNNHNSLYWCCNKGACDMPESTEGRQTMPNNLE